MPHPFDPRAPGVVIPEDMVPWPGGPEGPDDYDGNGVLMADGGWGYGNDLPGSWSRLGHQLSRKIRGPIIAYRRTKPGERTGKQKAVAKRDAAVRAVVVAMLLGVR